MKFTWSFSTKMNEECRCRELRRAKTMHQVLELTFIIKYTVISLYRKKLITFKIFTTCKSCKILIKSKSLFFNCIGEKVTNFLTFTSIVWRQVHICIVQYSTEMEVCFSVALGLRPSFICIWKINISDISFSCLVVFFQ